MPVQEIQAMTSLGNCFFDSICGGQNYSGCFINSQDFGGQTRDEVKETLREGDGERQMESKGNRNEKNCKVREIK